MAFSFFAKQTQKTCDVDLLHQMECKLCLHKGIFLRTDLDNILHSKIDYIVNHKLQCNVLSQNELTGNLEWKPIKNWYKNVVKGQKWIQLKLANCRSNSLGIICTPDHEIITTQGRIKAEDLVIGYHRIYIDEPVISKEQLGALVGTILGDGGLYKERLAYFKCRQKVKALIDFKTKLFKNLGGHQTVTSTTNVTTGVRFPVHVCWIPNSYQLKELYDITVLSTRFKSFNSYRSPRNIMKYLTPLGLALWYMDDGAIKRSKEKNELGMKQYATFCLKGFTPDDQEFIASWFRSYFNCVDKTHQGHHKGGVSVGHYDENLVFDGPTTRKFFDLIGRFVIPEFRYKVDDVSPPFDSELTIQTENISHSVLLESKLDYQSKSITRYCIEVEDNHNFFTANGLVSNCPLYNLPNSNKDIKPDGSLNAAVYLLGLGPGNEESKRAQFFIGPAGSYLKSCFSDRQWSETRRNNVTRTQHPDNKPPWEAVEACRPSVEKDIALVKPKIILGLGGMSLMWAFHQQTQPSIQAWRTHRFPINILGHTCWFWPEFHPSHLIRPEGKYLDGLFRLGIKNVYKFLERNLTPEVVDPKTLTDNCHALTTIADIKAALIELWAEPRISIDLEYTGEKPYDLDARILSFSAGTRKKAISFPIDHPQHPWSPKDYETLCKILLAFLLNNNQLKIAHNMSAELERLIFLFKKPEIAFCNWHDTMSPAYILNFGGNTKSKGDSDTDSEKEQESEKVYKGLLSLNNLSMAYLGCFIKNYSGVDVKNILREPLNKVLIYNCGDTKYTEWIDEKLMADIAHEKMQDLVTEMDQRVISVTLSKMQGVCVDVEKAKFHKNEQQNKVIQLYKDWVSNPDVEIYQAKYGKIDIGSPTDVANFYTSLGYDMFYTDNKGKQHRSSKDEILEKVKHPLASKVLEFREINNKVISTYVNPFVLGTESCLLSPDGKVHPEVTTHFTTSSRLSYFKPNLQNFPKKDPKYKHIRDMVIVPKGYIMVSLDYGSIEYRCIGMASKDKKLLDYIWSPKTDIHADWAIRCAKKYPQRIGGTEVLKRWLDTEPAILKKNDKEFGPFRQTTKNGFVFAACFGAGVPKLSIGMGIPKEIMQELYNEFWTELAGVRKWQKDILRFYDEHGYAVALSGLRRYGPIAHGELINFPIQCSAAFIMMDGMNRLVRHAIETGQHQFIPVISIHDDLSFYLPENTWEENLHTIIQFMLDCRYEWIITPLSIEASKGPNWAALEFYGEFNNTEELKVRMNRM